VLGIQQLFLGSLSCSFAALELSVTNINFKNAGTRNARKDMNPAIVLKRNDRRTESGKHLYLIYVGGTGYSPSASLCLHPIEFFSTYNVMSRILYDSIWGI
jgi:hypothetical protein